MKIEDLPWIDIDSLAVVEDWDTVVADARDDKSGLGLARSDRGLEVLSYAAILEFGRDTRFDASHHVRQVNRSGLYDGPAYDLLTGNMDGLQGEAHRRQRTAAAPWFKPNRAEQLREDVRVWVDAWLDEQVPGAEFDFENCIAKRLPSRLFCKIVGAPLDDAPHVVHLADIIFGVFGHNRPDLRDEIEQAAIELGAYVRGLIEEKRRQPADDLISTLLEAEGRGEISSEEIVYIAFTVLGAGIDTTNAATCMNLVTLAQHPDQWELLKREPERVPVAVQELMRFKSTAMTPTMRVTHQHFEFRGVEITPDDFVSGCAFAANKDPLVFDEPRRLNLAREFPRPPITFGSGVHSCIGRVVAIVEVEEVLRSILARWEQFEVDATWSGSPFMFIPQTVSVRFEAA